MEEDFKLYIGVKLHPEIKCWQIDPNKELSPCTLSRVKLEQTIYDFILVQWSTPFFTSLLSLSMALPWTFSSCQHDTHFHFGGLFIHTLFIILCFSFMTVAVLPWEEGEKKTFIMGNCCRKPVAHVSSTSHFGKFLVILIMSMSVTFFFGGTICVYLYLLLFIFF